MLNQSSELAFAVVGAISMGAMLNQSSELAFAVVGAISMGIFTGLCLGIIYTATMM